MKISTKFEKTWQLVCICLALGLAASLVIAVAFSPDLSDTLVEYLSSFIPDSKIRIERNLDYVSSPGQARSGDLYMPAAASMSAHPAIVLVHGGSWAKGDRGDISEIATARYLASRGFVAFVIDYRLGAGGEFPNDVLDVQSALRYLLKYKDKWSIDPARLYLGGSSSGATAAMLAAYMPEADLSSQKQTRSPQTNVKAVISFSGPTDLNKLSSANPYLRAYVKGYATAGKASSFAEQCNIASPVTYAKSAVATLFVHGTADKNVPIAQSLGMLSALKKYHIPGKLIMVEGGDHFLGMRSRKLSLEQSFDFLERPQ